MKTMKSSILGLSLLATILLPAENGSAQILNTFNSNFSATNNNWNSASNWTRVGGAGSVPLTPSDKAVISSGASRNLVVNADDIHVGELEYGAGTGTARIAANGTRSVIINTLTKGGTYALSINNADGHSLTVQIGNLNLNQGSIEIGNPANGSLNGFKVTGTTTLAAEFAFNGVNSRAAETNRIELGNLVLQGAGAFTLGGRGNSNGTAKISSLSGEGVVQVSSSDAHNGTAGTLLIESANASPVTFSGLLRDQQLTQTAVLTVVKSGTGIQIFSQSSGNTYSGSTTIESGVLAVTNSSGSGFGSGQVNVSNGGVLAGSGIVAPGSGKSITVQSGGSIAPTAHLESGFSVLKFNGANNASSTILDMEEGSYFTLRFGEGNAGDRIDFINYHAGGLGLFEGGIAVNGSGVQEGVFTLFTFDTITGTELKTLGESLRAGSGFGGFETNFSWNDNSIMLQVTAIPEPGLTSLAVVSAALLAGTALRRKGFAEVAKKL